MKKLGILALLMSLGLFTFGCTQSENTGPAENGAAPEEMAPADEAPAEEAPAEEAPAEDGSEG